MSNALPLKLISQAGNLMEAHGKPKGFADLSAAELSVRIAAGSDEAFDRFYHLYTRRVYALLFSLTGGDEHLTRDLHQLVFIRAARRFPRFESEAKLWNWLSAVARHALLDHLRQSYRRNQREQISAAPPLDEPSQAQETMLARLEAALAELPSGDRDLLNQFYFAHESQDAIAERLGTTSKAIQSKLARLRLKLRSHLLRNADRL